MAERRGAQQATTSARTPSVPPLFFARHFKLPENHGVRFLVRQNAVMHIKLRGNPFKTSVRKALCGSASEKKIDVYSSSDASSPFEHNKFSCGGFGTIMQFKKNKKLTRAGKATHADAFRATVFFLKWSKDPDWPVSLDTNNLVVNGQFVDPIPPNITSNFRRAGHSSKYPGIALRFEGMQCTPEVYMKRSTFIVPGVTQVPCPASARKGEGGECLLNRQTAACARSPLHHKSPHRR